MAPYVLENRLPHSHGECQMESSIPRFAIILIRKPQTNLRSVVQQREDKFLSQQHNANWGKRKKREGYTQWPASAELKGCCSCRSKIHTLNNEFWIIQLEEMREIRLSWQTKGVKLLSQPVMSMPTWQEGGRIDNRADDRSPHRALSSTSRARIDHEDNSLRN